MLLNLFFAAFCLFNPPDDWELANSKAPSQSEICGFIDKSHSGFCPSIHLTRETTSCNIEEYLAIVSKNARSQKRKWRRMGAIDTQSGTAHLIGIELDHSLGKVSLLQAILPRAGEMHILTAGALKQDLAKCASLFHQAFQSMEIVENLFPLAKNPEAIHSYWQKRGDDLESFRKAVLEESSLGPVYQIQLMRLK